jgi:uncharacterized Ntn-hydrolase superfamily protein
MTYSLVARDAETGELGVAVQSRAFRTGAVCAWARAGVGAIATQSFTDIRYGVRGLELLAEGVGPEEALARLLADDERPEFRQVAFLGTDGQTAAHTGDACVPFAGHIDEENVSVQGNMLASQDVWPAMLDGFRSAHGSLADRLLHTLDAAEAAGGDYRGRQAGAVLVVSAERSDTEPWDGRVVDVRVDDSEDPLAELRRLVRLTEAHRRLGRPASGSSPEKRWRRRAQQVSAKTRSSSPAPRRPRLRATSSGRPQCSARSSTPTAAGSTRSTATSGSGSSRSA